MNTKYQYENFDAADYLQTPEDIALYLEDIMQDDDPQLLLEALGDVIRASRNISELSRETGISRETLYKSMSKEGNPKYSNLVSVLHSLGLSLTVKPMQAIDAEKSRSILRK